MRRSTALPKPPAGQPLGQTHAWLTLRTLFPYLWRYRLRVLAALGCLIGAKVANVGVPMIFKEMIDGLSVPQQTLALPILLLALYGILRFSTSLFTELREILFARVTQRAVRQASLEVFRHLHALSLRFHLDRQTGGVSRDIERGSRSIASLISYTLYSILPTLVEIGLVHPPVGMNLFIIQKLAKDVPYIETAKGVMPFLASDFIRIGFLVFFPSITLWLVHAMG
jgi:ATP-binding cassette subfamily B protein